jgi:3-oxoisoapionate decarboxylase
MIGTMNRREALAVAGGAVLGCLISNNLAAVEAPKTRVGIGMHSFGIHWSMARRSTEQAPFKDALGFLDFCHSLGAAGVQVAMGPDVERAAVLRERASKYGMYLEGQTSLPRNEADIDRFEADLRAVNSAGATVIRTAMLSGRRYETFDSLEKFKEFAERSWRSLVLAEPVVRKQGLKLAVENHKDWLVEELVAMLKRIDSEHVGVCIDTGNSIALLEDPMAVVEAYAPYAVSTHLKDMGVREYEHGFLLSEVPLGTGYLDLKKIIATCRSGNPKVKFNLEMITRDPLRIPCRIEQYWATFPGRRGAVLEDALAAVKERSSKQELPVLTGMPDEAKARKEVDNVRESLVYAPQQLGL